MKNRRKIEYTLHLKKYKYTKTDYDEVIEEETVNELSVKLVSWLAVERDLREFYRDMLGQVNTAIEENNKTKKPEQVAFEMSAKDPNKRDVQMLRAIRIECLLLRKYIVLINMLLKRLLV